MRLPIAYTPINCLLIVMMILSPWIGKKAKEHLQSKHETRQIQKIKESFTASKPKKKKLKKRSKKRKVAVEPSIKLLAQAQEQIIEELKANEKSKEEEEEPTEKQFLLGESRVIELSNQSNESIKQSKKIAFSQVEKPLSTPKTKKHYMRKIRDHAVNKDYMSAESVFLEMLESQDITLSPLDSLEKLDQFKSKFEKLSKSLAKN